MEKPPLCGTQSLMPQMVVDRRSVTGQRLILLVGRLTAPKPLTADFGRAICPLFQCFCIFQVFENGNTASHVPHHTGKVMFSQ